jgi:3-polyprenyl-4-hydroxybenzoate decarboxylase
METGLTTKVGIDATRPLKTLKDKFEKASVPLTDRAAKIIDKIKTGQVSY